MVTRNRIWTATAIGLAAALGAVMSDPGPLIDYPMTKWVVSVVAIGLLAAIRGAPTP